MRKKKQKKTKNKKNTEDKLPRAGGLRFFFYIFVGFINLVPKKFWTKMMSARSKKPMIFCEG